MPDGLVPPSEQSVQLRQSRGGMDEAWERVRAAGQLTKIKGTFWL
jgi:hypothetical protein